MSEMRSETRSEMLKRREREAFKTTSVEFVNKNGELVSKVIRRSTYHIIEFEGRTFGVESSEPITLEFARKKLMEQMKERYGKNPGFVV